MRTIGCGHGKLGMLTAALVVTAIGCSDGSEPQVDPATGAGASAAGGSGAEGGAGSTSGGAGGADGGAGAVGAGGGSGGAPVDLGHTITVIDPQGHVVEGIDILSHDADGEIHQQAKTSIGGEAAVEIPEGGSVMALWSTNGDLHSRMIHDVPAGADVRIRITGIKAAPPPAPPATVFSHYIYSKPQGATRVGVEIGCDEDWLQGIELSVEVSNGKCAESPTQDLLFSGRDADGNFVGWELFANTPTKPGGEVHFEVGITQDALHDVQLALDGVPAGAKYLKHRADVIIGTTTSVLGKDVASSSAAVQSTFTLPTIPAARYATFLAAGTGNGTSGSSFTYRLEDAWAIDQTFVDANDYGWIEADLADVSDPTRPKASWSIDAPPPVDACQVFMSWMDAAGEHAVDFESVMSPGHATALQMPKLPDALAAYRPGSGAAPPSTVSVECSEWGNIAGYGDVLAAKEPAVVDGTPEVHLSASAYTNSNAPE